MLPANGLLKRSWPMFIQYTEAHRKPRWLPVAKSKIYRIPKRPVLPPEEVLELKRITNNYKTQMRAMKRFFVDEMEKEKATTESSSSEMSLKIDAEEWERCVQLNEKWNAQVAAEREERRKRELAEREEYILARIVAKEKELQKRTQKANEEIKKQKELSTTFITPETLDEAIDKALANPIDYNFAIDLQGNIYHGRDTDIVLKKNEEKSELRSNV